jgi:hypothetical protein
MWDFDPSYYRLIFDFFPPVRLKPIELYILRKNLIKVETYLSIQSKCVLFEHYTLGDGMISLKKNDKIIIIVAVVVLVIAGVGVAMYQSPKSTIPPPATTGVKIYDVKWTLRNGSLTTISDFAGKKTPYQSTVSLPVGNIKTITFNLTWTDDHMTVLKRMGLDTLTLEIITPDGSSYIEANRSAPITGKGYVLLTISPNIIPPVTPIKADDERAALAKLKLKPYYDDSWANKDMNVTVSVQIGEMRILKKMRDKGNNFDLTISYQYYDGSLKVDSTKNTGIDDTTTPPEDPWVNQNTPPYMSMIINTGCGRFV